MRCVICNDLFFIKRNILELFHTQKEYICNRCYKRYPINLRYEAIQLEKYNCVILSMFKKTERIEYNGFYKEYSKLFIANMHRKGFKALFFNHIRLNDETLEVFDAYSKLLRSDIIILCLSIIDE
ncbi:MAG: hypothetical protein IJM36_05030 [Acholeplasmatales bacterium]|nr:hypothetical protein [Acholeplasmatales bacterium]